MKPLVWGALAVVAVGSWLGFGGSFAQRGVDVVFYVDDGHHFSDEEKTAIEGTVRETAAEVRVLLPTVPRELIVRVHAGRDVIPEVGATAEVSPPNVVYWTVDPNRPGGVLQVVHKHLRATLFHELHHLVRGEGHSFMDRVLSEGLATVFERDYSDAKPPWGNYPRNVVDWIPEVAALPPDAPWDVWMGRHPDGRRWIGYKVGTYLVDRAMKQTRRSVVDLTALPTQEIVRLAATP